MVSPLKRRPLFLLILKQWIGWISVIRCLKNAIKDWGVQRQDAFFLWFTPYAGGKMAKKQFASSAHDRRVTKNARHIPDHEIDFSDIPESTTEELKSARRVGRPRSGKAKQLIAIRIAPQLLNHLKQIAHKKHKPYQTLIHEYLEKMAK